MKAVIKNNLTQGQGLSATQKLSLVVGSASVLYLLPTEADAAIIHVTPVTPPTINQGQPSGTQALWDVDGDTNPDFRLENSLSILDFGSNGLNGQGVVQATSIKDGIKKLPLNNLVGLTLAAGYEFSPAGDNRTIMKNSFIAGDFDAGGFTGNPPEYFGFRFLSGGDTFYGWANINIDTATDGGTVTIT